jgi:Ser/Thr protein kinase RdoA (MazF antagonist)
MNLPHDVQTLSRQFQLSGKYLSAEPYGSGHINDTFRVSYDRGGTVVHYLLQRINHQIFKNPPALMENVRRVTEHIRGKLAAKGDVSRRALTIIPTRDGELLHRDEAGNFWRTYVFIENARTFDAVETAAQAYQAAKEFGQFQKLLADLPSPPLAETIPDFHNTPKRFAAFEQAIADDKSNRAASVKSEIEFALSRKPIASVLLTLCERGEMPERTTHNDTKFNNVMLDKDTNEGLCVIDLDTVMPGLSLYDFGDMVRTTTSPAMEDERDLSKVEMQMPMFEALVSGYLSTAAEFLTPAERALLAFAGKLITFEQGIRFLGDYLNGDVYYKTHREGHNLDRCRTQFKLVECIERQEEQMNRLSEKY